MDCPVCQTSNIDESIKFCPTCGYDISPYPLVLGHIPTAFIEKEKQRIAWAKKLWRDCRAKIAETEAKIAQQAKIAQSQAVNSQVQDQLNKIVSQIEQLNQNQITSAELSELVKTDVEAKFSEIEQRLETEIASQFDRLTEKYLTKQSLSEASQVAVTSADVSNIKISRQTFSFTTVKVNGRGQIIKQETLEAQYFTENLGNDVILEMVYIPGGTFIMGSPEIEKERKKNEGLQHRVTVPSFFMGKYLVTQGQWQAVMGSNPSKFQGVNRPVEQVSWHDAVEFCQTLSKKTGKTYRLPSEAEWEYACRAGTSTPFYFGETLTTDLANYNGNGTYDNGPKGICRKETTDVGIFPPNAFGLYDMHGNVLEWCADPWHENYNSAPSDGSVWISRGDSDYRLLRGGNWSGDPRFCRSARRDSYSPGNRSNGIGLRVAVSPARTP